MQPHKPFLCTYMYITLGMISILLPGWTCSCYTYSLVKEPNVLSCIHILLITPAPFDTHSHSGLTAVAAFLLTREVWNSRAGLLAACCMAIVPGYISRSVAGSYDNEGIAIFALLFTYFLWLKSVKTGSVMWATAAALSYFYMVSKKMLILRLWISTWVSSSGGGVKFPLFCRKISFANVKLS